LLPDRRGTSVDPVALARGGFAWPAEPAIYVITPESRDVVPLLQQHSPSGRLVDGSPAPLKESFFVFFPVPAA
jgi:hypothetical protein